MSQNKDLIEKHRIVANRQVSLRSNKIEQFKIKQVSEACGLFWAWCGHDTYMEKNVFPLLLQLQTELL